VMEPLAEYTAGSDVRLRWSPAVDVGAGGVRYMLRITADGYENTTGWLEDREYVFHAPSESRYCFAVMAEDALGYSTIYTQEVCTAVDLAPPALTVDEPQEGAYLNSTTVAFSGSASDAWGVVSVRVLYHGMEVAASGNDTWKASIELEDGQHTVTVMAMDRAGRTTRATLNITVDSTAPEVSAQDADSQSDRFTVSFDLLEEGSGLEECHAYLDGEEVAVSLVSRTVTGTASDGNHTLEITARDRAGNTGRAVVHVYVDTQVPQIAGDVPSKTSRKKMEISGMATDASDVVSVEVSTDGGASWAPCTGTDTWSCEVALSPGKNTVSVRATDALGNTGSAEWTVKMEVPQTISLSDVLPPLGVILAVAALLLALLAFMGMGRRRKEEPLSELEMQPEAEHEEYVDELEEPEPPAKDADLEAKESEGELEGGDTLLP